jgi:hypothetical protein
MAHYDCKWCGNEPYKCCKSRAAWSLFQQIGIDVFVSARAQANEEFAQQIEKRADELARKKRGNLFKQLYVEYFKNGAQFEIDEGYILLRYKPNQDPVRLFTL